MGWGNLLGYMFSSSFTQYKVVKGSIFTTALQKDKLNPIEAMIMIKFHDP